MDRTKALQNLLKGKATKKEIELLKQALASGEISIGGDVQRSIVIMGDGNSISLTPEALDLLKPETKTEEQIEGDPPYMGLRYFDTQDADLFYGREALTRELLARVQKESFLAIVGASGSGKSSVARAGLIPAWMKENERGAVYIITPTAHPLERLAASLTRESESVTATSTLMDDLKNDSRSLRLYVKKMFGETKLLLLVDQFEETFTLCKDVAERKAFIENLLSLADDEGAARVVITLRADFYHHCAEYEGLRNALKTHQEYIGAMTADELQQAITIPAENNGWDFQPGLVDLILSDVGTEPGALPLLSHALLETWKRRQGHTLTLQGYHDAGGVKKAIAQTAESVYDKLTPAEQTIARSIFLRLTELGEGVQDTRRRVKMDELAQTKGQESVAKVLKTLTDARLVTTEQDSAEVAHEALIREWGTLRKWLDEDRDSLRLHRHLTESAHEWERQGRDAGELIRGTRLDQVLNWEDIHETELSSLEEEFVKASQLARTKERQATRIRRLSAITAAVIVFVIIMLAVTGSLGKIINPILFPPLPMEWVSVPSGQFSMGSNNYFDQSPIHSVYLNSFEIGKNEVTNNQYYQCVRANICPPPGSDSYTSEHFSNYPVVGVSWSDADSFCRWNDPNGRLPTEAEWEKSARGSNGGVYPWGNNAPNCNLANYSPCLSDAKPVGSFPKGKSPYGINDMAGNVWEWVYDWYSENYYAHSPYKNPLGPTNGTSHVARGGSWYQPIDYLESTIRFNFIPGARGNDIGFRCARDVP